MKKYKWLAETAHAELNKIASELSFDVAKGVYILEDKPSVYGVYLPYGDAPGFDADDELKAINVNVEFTIFTGIDTNYLEVEAEVQEKFHEYGYAYVNGVVDVSDSEPYNYYRTLHYTKAFYYDGEEGE